MAGNNHIGRSKAEGEQLRRLGGIVGQVGLFGGELIVQELAGAVTDAQVRRRQELDKNAVAVFDSGFGTLFIFLRELFAQGGEATSPLPWSGGSGPNQTCSRTTPGRWNPDSTVCFETELVPG